MYIQSFERYEKKYLITEEQFSEFTERAAGMILPDKYGAHTIRNIYLDTDDFYLIRRSLDKPVYKEKLRLRSYGSPVGEGAPIFFEIKKKYNEVVYKRRISIDPCALEKYLSSGELPEGLDGTDRQIFMEIDCIMKRISPAPRVYIAYDRIAFIGTENADLRVTFDKNIRSRADDLTLSDDRAELLAAAVDDYRLMEIKSGGAVPFEMARLLSEMKIYPVTFSKYGEVYKNIQIERKSQKCSATYLQT